MAWLIVFSALIKGVKSLGKAVWFTALFPYLILSILLLFGLSLDGAIDGIKYYVTPNMSRLWDIQVVTNNNPIQGIPWSYPGMGRCCHADILLPGSLLGLLDNPGIL